MNLYWHFLPDNGKTRWDNRKVSVGDTLRITNDPVMCKQGFHASRRLIDALEYAPGSLLCRVTLGGRIIHDDAKSVAQERTVVSMIGTNDILHEFACRCAEDALRQAGVKDERCWNAIRVKRAWLAGKASDQELDAAWTAAKDAARDASTDPARDAAWTTATAAARVAATAAARDAARAAMRAREMAAETTAVWGTAWTAAWVMAKQATRYKQNRRLTSMVVRIMYARRRRREHEITRRGYTQA